MSIQSQSSIIKYLIKKEPSKEEKILASLSKDEKKQKEKQQIQHSSQSDVSAKTEKIQTNVEFYTNKITSEPYGDTIDGIHKKWWGNYNLLEKHHGYIQWLFPNSFQSRFNNKSHPLSPDQAIEFRNNIQIAEKYRRSYIMMLQFYGIKMKSKTTGELMRTRKPSFQQRYKETFLTNFHNHMRITRMLSSLTMIGLGRYAKELCKFLKEQIFSEGGKLKYLKSFKVYEREWRQFQEYKESEEDLNVILREKKEK